MPKESETQTATREALAREILVNMAPSFTGEGVFSTSDVNMMVWRAHELARVFCEETERRRSV